MDALGVHPPHLQQLGDPLGVALGVAEDHAKHTRNQIQPVAFDGDGRLVPSESK